MSAALCWVLISGIVHCTAPGTDTKIQAQYEFAKENMDKTKATEVLIVHPKERLWETVLKQHPKH